MQTVKFKSKTVQVPGKNGVKNDTQSYVSPSGKAYLPGTEAEVTDKQAAWLEANGWIEPPAPKKQKKENKEAAGRETK